VAGNAAVRILGDLLGAFGRPDFEDRVKRAFDTLNELMNAPGFARLLEIMFRYILQVFDIPKEDLGNLVIRTLKPDVKEFLMTTYEQLKQEGRQEGEQKGRKEGEQKGRQEGANLVLGKLLSKKFQVDPVDLMPLLSKVTAAQQEELIERVLQSPSLQEIIDWLKATGQN
jgi:hypothetical protein